MKARRPPRFDSLSEDHDPSVGASSFAVPLLAGVGADRPRHSPAKGIVHCSRYTAACASHRTLELGSDHM